MTRKLAGGAAGLLVLLCALTLLIGFGNKQRCTGPEFDSSGRSTPGYSERNYQDACYSDIQFLWVGRDINKHSFPYVHGELTAEGTLSGGTVEYPVLTGVLIWVGGLFADTDAGFLAASALVLAPFGLLTAWLLARMSGWRALLWALGPPLVLYAFHNWDLPAVAATVGAWYVLTRESGRGLRFRAGMAAALLGLGFALKLYPAIFVVPLALYVLTGGRQSEQEPDANSFDVVGALRVLGIAAGTGAAANLPFALAGFDGWWASFEFQADREVDATTNSLWYWAFRPDSDPDNAGFQAIVNVASPVLVLASFAAACAVGWYRYRREGSFPLLAVCAAMLCGFLLLHKVHSPQYTLWLLPMFVLLRVRLGWVGAYLLADLAMGIGAFRWYAALSAGQQALSDGFAGQAMMIGVWGRAALLVGLFVAFLSAETTLGGHRDVRSGPFLARTTSSAPSSTPPAGSSAPVTRTRSDAGR